jgi:beta-lactamase superfamily II metal-dependent hydrolase
MVDSDFFEIDFLAVETAKSGDAITIRYKVNELEYIHVVDGGFTETGQKVIEHVDSYYGEKAFIDNVALTHSDRDHANGLKYVLENGNIGILWMNRPWHHASDLIDRFKTYNSIDALIGRLKKCYPSVVELEEIAVRRGIEIRSAFQGTTIGAFTVMSPSKATYLDLIVESEKTPEGIDEAEKDISQILTEALKAATSKVKGVWASFWGEEVFSPEDTSAENEMSIVQTATLCGTTILLTGDTGRRGLQSVIDYAPYVGLNLPGIDRFQVPHHGSRRNLNSELLDQILGERQDSQSDDSTYKFTAIISSAKADTDHPRKAVIRAMHHRGGRVIATEGRCISTFHNAPSRNGWGPVECEPYPTEQEN